MRKARSSHLVRTFAVASSLLVAGLAGLACSSSNEAGGFSTNAPSRNGGGGSGGGEEGGDEGDGDPNDLGETNPQKAGCTDVIDVVFVLDTSSTMNFVFSKLGDEIGEVVSAATKIAPNPHFGLIAFTDNHRLDTSGPEAGGKVHLAANTLQRAFRDYAATYNQFDRNPGDGPTGRARQNPLCEENSIDALYAAANDFPWRPNATRVVIIATDDTFLEKPDNYGDGDGDGKFDKTLPFTEGDYPARYTMREAVDALRAQRARVFSFTRLQTPGSLDLNACGTPRRLANFPNPVAMGWSTGYKGQAPIPQQTGGKNFDLDAVRSGSLKLAATINEVVLSSYCNPPK
jgi:hypothetical protein